MIYSGYGPGHRTIIIIPGVPGFNAVNEEDIAKWKKVIDEIVRIVDEHVSIYTSSKMVSGLDLLIPVDNPASAVGTQFNKDILIFEEFLFVNNLLLTNGFKILEMKSGGIFMYGPRTSRPMESGLCI